MEIGEEEFSYDELLSLWLSVCERDNIYVNYII